MEKTPIKQHGAGPHLTAPIISAIPPESGKDGFGSPSGTHVERQGWDASPRNARQFQNVEKKQHEPASLLQFHTIIELYEYLKDLCGLWSPGTRLEIGTVNAKLSVKAGGKVWHEFSSLNTVGVSVHRVLGRRKRLVKHRFRVREG